MFGILSKVEGSLEIRGKKSSRLFTRNDWLVTSYDHRTKVAQVEFLHIGLGGFGPIKPFSNTQRRHEVFSQLQHAGRFDFALTCGLQRLVLFTQRLPNGRDAAAKDLLGDRLVLIG